MISGPRGWAVCHDTAREPRMFLGYLHSDDVRLLNHEFGLHRRNFLGHQLQFKDSIAGRALKQIMLHDPVRAALFRKADASLLTGPSKSLPKSRRAPHDWRSKDASLLDSGSVRGRVFSPFGHHLIR
ncbi:hypothetical protein ABIF66_003642 [Bradyrhizobium japonicum]